MGGGFQNPLVVNHNCLQSIRSLRALFILEGVAGVRYGDSLQVPGIRTLELQGKNSSDELKLPCDWRVESAGAQVHRPTC